MYCIKCGKQIPEGQVACNECTLELLQKELQAKNVDTAPTRSEPMTEDAPADQANPVTEEAVPGYTEPVINIEGFVPPVYTQPLPKKKSPKSPCSAKATVSFILSCVSLYLVLQALSTPGLVAIILCSLFIAAVVISIVFGAKSLSGCKVITETGVQKDTRTFVFGLIGMIQGILSALFISFSFLI